MSAAIKTDTIFDRAYNAANDNLYARLVHDDPEDRPRPQRHRRFKECDVPVTIPGGKTEARLMLATFGVGCDCSISRACTNANLPLDRGWRGELKEPPAPRAWKPRHHKKPVRDDLANWPLAEALRRDGRESDLPAVVRYRDLFDAVVACPYSLDVSIGSDGETGIWHEYRSVQKGAEEVDKAVKAGWPSDKIPGGEISYRERRRVVRQSAPVGRRTGVSDEGAAPGSSLLDFGYREGDPIDRIDGKPVLARLAEALRVNPYGDRAGGMDLTLFDLLNLAALGNSTMTDVGGLLGFKHKARSREAKVRIYTAVDILRDEWRRIEDWQAEEAEQCHHRVLARRAELAAQQAAYFRRAA